MQNKANLKTDELMQWGGETVSDADRGSEVHQHTNNDKSREEKQGRVGRY